MLDRSHVLHPSPCPVISEAAECLLLPVTGGDAAQAGRRLCFRRHRKQRARPGACAAVASAWCILAGSLNVDQNFFSFSSGVFTLENPATACMCAAPANVQSQGVVHDCSLLVRIHCIVHTGIYLHTGQQELARQGLGGNRCRSSSASIQGLVAAQLHAGCQCRCA